MGTLVRALVDVIQASPFAFTAAAIGMPGGDASPGARGLLAFTNEAMARGLVCTVAQPATYGHGLAFADLDGDGDADAVILGAANDLLAIFENDGRGSFIDHTVTAAPVLTSQSSVVAADYDGDGDMDLYIGRLHEHNTLLRNDGDFFFVDVTEAAGVEDGANSPTYGCAWGDYDGDGHIDLYVSNRSNPSSAPNRLYRNLGNGTFVDVAPTLGVDRPGDPTFQASFLDYDLDGDADLYVANDKGMGCSSFRNFLFENQGDGTFLDVTALTGTEGCVLSMCIAIGDFDGNAWPDLFVTNGPAGHALMMANGHGGFDRAEDEAGVAGGHAGWGAVFADLDLDGFEDLYVCNQYAANHLFRHDGTWPTTDIAMAAGVDDAGASFAIATADVDLDGDLDLMLSNQNEPVRLFINQAEGSWLRLRIAGGERDGAAHPHSIGARLEAHAGGRVYWREVIAGSNYLAQNELTAHIGLGAASTLDSAVVTWPNGDVRVLTDLAGDTAWVAYPPLRLGDADADGDRDHDDFNVLMACAGTLQPGCEIMDATGDAVIDDADLAAFLRGYDGLLRDCDGDGELDLEAIFRGTAPDLDGDGLPDTCEHAFGDITGDLVVSVEDLLALLVDWGMTGSAADVDGNGVVGVGDLLIVLANWD